jgi:hypothetical protein
MRISISTKASTALQQVPKLKLSEEGCQILQHAKMGKYIPNNYNVYQMAVEHSKRT